MTVSARDYMELERVVVAHGILDLYRYSTVGRLFTESHVHDGPTITIVIDHGFTKVLGGGLEWV